MELVQLLEIAQENCGLGHGAPVLVGVSGGPDSLCLLDSLHLLGFQVVAAHFDHHLRPESAQDAAQVRAFSESHGIPCLVGDGEVAGYAAQERLSVEEAARLMRYHFLFDQARQISAQAVAVGHTADDQVETVLMHLLRGSGLAGLKGMGFRSQLPTWDARIPLVRPLLAFWRDEILARCQERGLRPLFDPTNQDTAFFRNRLRGELIPYLEGYNPQVRQVLWRTAQVLGGEDAIVQEVLQSAWQSCLLVQEGQAVALDLSAFQAFSPGLQRGLLRKAIGLLLPGLRDLDYQAVERAARRASTPGSGQVDLVRGLRLVVEGERLWIAGDAPLPVADGWPQITGETRALAVPGEMELAPGWRLSAALAAGRELEDFHPDLVTRWEAWLDADTLPGPLCVRPPRAGDRFRPLGMGGHSVKLSDFWINYKLPQRARAAWPLVASGNEIVWAPGFRLAQPYRMRETTRRALVLRLFRD